MEIDMKNRTTLTATDVQAARTLLGLTQAAFGAKLNISDRAVRDLESEGARGATSRLIEVLIAQEVTPEYDGSYVWCTLDHLEHAWGADVHEWGLLGHEPETTWELVRLKPSDDFLTWELERCEDGQWFGAIDDEYQVADLPKIVEGRDELRQEMIDAHIDRWEDGAHNSLEGFATWAYDERFETLASLKAREYRVIAGDLVYEFQQHDDIPRTFFTLQDMAAWLERHRADLIGLLEEKIDDE